MKKTGLLMISIYAILGLLAGLDIFAETRGDSLIITKKEKRMYFKLVVAGGEMIYRQYHYIEIQDSKDPLIIPRWGGNKDETGFKNIFLYIGRDLRTDTVEYKKTVGFDPAYDVEANASIMWGYENEYGSFPWAGFDNLRQITFGKYVTQLPYYGTIYYDWDKNPGWYKKNIDTIYNYFIPVKLKENDVHGGYIIRFNSRELHYNPRIRTNEKLLGGYEVRTLKIGPENTLFQGIYFPYVIRIYCEAAVPPILETPFTDEQYAYTMLYVPIGRKKEYASAEGWKNFANIIESEIASVGVDSPADDSDIFFNVIDGHLYVSGEMSPGRLVEVYTISGSLIYRGADRVIPVPKGVLIVRCGGKVKKLLNMR